LKKLEGKAWPANKEILDDNHSAHDKYPGKSANRG